MADKQLNARGLKCPMPIAKISADLRGLAAGQTLEVIADDPAFGEDVKAFCRVTANEMLSLTEAGGETTAVIRKK